MTGEHEPVYTYAAGINVIICDHDGCTTEIAAAGINVWLDGWTKRNDRDYCPEHTPHDRRTARNSPTDER